MAELVIDLFAEDRAHEELLRAIIARLAQEAGFDVAIQIRAARGGHGRALSELDTYMRLLERGVLPIPDIIVTAIDANCRGFNQAVAEIRRHIQGSLLDRAVIACPDPHIERWYLADPPSFRTVVGSQPSPGKRKCERDLYKRKLIDAIRAAENIPTLGGIEYAADLAAAMDLYRAGKNEPSLGSFVDDLQRLLKLLAKV